jgi:protein SCO1/2
LHLNDQHGQARTLADFRGKVVVLFFGYTHCPDVCPTTLSDLKIMMDSLGKDADKVQVLFATLDPERDSPDMLAAYVSAFNSTFLALSGDVSTTAQTAAAFNITYKKRPTTSGYGIDHSDGSYIIDQKGRVRLLASYPLRGEMLAQDIRLLLAGA